MRLITARTIEQFASAHPDAAQELSDWVAMVEVACWTSGDQLRRVLGGSARPLGNGRAVFNIKGNHYRIIVTIRYAAPDRGFNGVVKVQFIGTHAEYDKVDALTVTWSGGSPRSTS